MLKTLSLLVIFLGIISCSNSLSPKEKKEYVKKGKEVVQGAFKGLSDQLTAHMKEGGPAQAIPFCNAQALPITHQLSEKYNVTIKRTSDKFRNPKNQPTEKELAIINDFKIALAHKKELKPIVEMNNNNNAQFYAPIIMNEKCLVCHGKQKEQLSIKTDSLIKSLYPKDIAVGYEDGDLRGIWSVTFKN